MAEDIEARFERYCEAVVSALAHADRRAGIGSTLLRLPGSINPFRYVYAAAAVLEYDRKPAGQDTSNLGVIL